MNHDETMRDLEARLSPEEFKQIIELKPNFDTYPLAVMWADYTNPEERIKRETPILRRFIFPGDKVLDTSAGIGVTARGLYRGYQGLERYYDGISNVFLNEHDPNYREEARRFLTIALGRIPEIRDLDWKDLGQAYKNEFDVALCVGNSLTYVNDANERGKTLISFRDTLKPRGILIIDERNYGKILENSGEFKQGLRDSQTKDWGAAYYGEPNRITASAPYISERVALLRFKHHSGIQADAAVYPFKPHELVNQLRENGFSILTAFDSYAEEMTPERIGTHDCHGFTTYICRKEE